MLFGYLERPLRSCHTRTGTDRYTCIYLCYTSPHYARIKTHYNTFPDLSPNALNRTFLYTLALSYSTHSLSFTLSQLIELYTSLHIYYLILTLIYNIVCTCCTYYVVHWNYTTLLPDIHNYTSAHTFNCTFSHSLLRKSHYAVTHRTEIFHVYIKIFGAVYLIVCQEK